MKITMDKQMTSVALADDVKAAMKEFKARYTDSDLRNVMWDHLAAIEMYDAASAIGGEILDCKVSAFPSLSYSADEVWFAVDMVVNRWLSGFTYARFYVNQDLKLDTRPDLITINAYQEAKKYF